MSERVYTDRRCVPKAIPGWLLRRKGLRLEPQAGTRSAKAGYLMKTTKHLVAFAVGLLAAEAQALTLTGTVRDFSPTTHPDFESTLGGLQVGQLENTFGPDG